MPFITQCPYDDCEKYMLLEDEVQGTTVDCLCCKRPVELVLDCEPAGAPIVDAEPAETTKDRTRDRTKTADPAGRERFVVRNCPKCHHALRIPPEKKRKAVACLNCDYWEFSGEWTIPLGCDHR